MSESLNDFIHQGAARMVENTNGFGTYAFYEEQLRRWIEFLILNDEDTISSVGWVLTRRDRGDRVNWSLQRNHLTYTDFDSSETPNIIYSH